MYFRFIIKPRRNFAPEFGLGLLSWKAELSPAFTKASWADLITSGPFLKPRVFPPLVAEDKRARSPLIFGGA